MKFVYLGEIYEVLFTGLHMHELSAHGSTHAMQWENTDILPALHSQQLKDQGSRYGGRIILCRVNNEYRLIPAFEVEKFEKVNESVS